MLQKTSNQKLDNVLQTIQRLGIRFPIAELSRKMKRSSGEVSAYLSNKKIMSEKFYNDFVEIFGPAKTETLIVTEKDKALDTISDLSRSGLVVAEANKVLADNNKQLIELLRIKISAAKESRTEQSLEQILDLIADRGVGSLWRSKDEGLQALGSILRGHREVKKE
jgi:hypothetical protein